MNISARIEELTQQQQVLLQRQQEDATNIQRLAGAIAILSEQLAEEKQDAVSPNGHVAEIEAVAPTG
jgi:hypothetical protein